MAAIEAVVADPLTDAVPDGWDEAVTAFGRSPLWRAGMLSSLAWLDKYRPLMVLAKDLSGKPCGLFWGRLLGAPNGPLSFHDPGRWPLLGLFEFALPPGITRAGYQFHPDLDPASRVQALAVVEGAVGARLGARCLGFAYRQVAAADVTTFGDHGCRLLAAAPQSVLDKKWGTFDDYLNALPVAGRREMQRIRRIVDGDPTVRFAVESTVDANDAAQLAHAVRDRHRIRGRVTPPVPNVFFEKLGQYEGTSFVTYRDVEGRLLAFGTMLDEGSSVRSHGWGLRERTDGGRPNLYFDHFLREVELFIASGTDRMVLGKGMAEIKRRFGGHLEELNTAVRLRVATPRVRSGGGGGLPRSDRTQSLVGGVAAVVGRTQLLTRSADVVDRLRGLPPERGTVTADCPQCGQDRVDVIRLTANRARLACRACEAAVTIDDLTVLRPVVERRTDRARSSEAKAPERADPRAGFVSAVMLEWCRDGAPALGTGLDKGSIYGLWKAFDRFLAAARTDPGSAARYATFAVRAGASVEVPQKLPSFGEVVGLLHAHCYDERAVTAASIADMSVASMIGLAERVACARRWLAGPGRQHCWIERRPEGDRVDCDALSSLLADRTGPSTITPEQREALFNAVFGTSGGPPTGALLEHFGWERLRLSIEEFLMNGSHALRSDVLGALDGAAVAGPVEFVGT